MTATESARIHAARMSQYWYAERHAAIRAALDYRRLLRTAKREGLLESDLAAGIRWFQQRRRATARRFRELERAARAEVRRVA